MCCGRISCGECSALLQLSAVSWCLTSRNDTGRDHRLIVHRQREQVFKERCALQLGPKGSLAPSTCTEHLALASCAAPPSPSQWLLLQSPVCLHRCVSPSPLQAGAPFDTSAGQGRQAAAGPGISPPHTAAAVPLCWSSYSCVPAAQHTAHTSAASSKQQVDQRASERILPALNWHRKMRSGERWGSTSLQQFTQLASGCRSAPPSGLSERRCRSGVEAMRLTPIAHSSPRPSWAANHGQMFERSEGPAYATSQPIAQRRPASAGTAPQRVAAGASAGPGSEAGAAAGWGRPDAGRAGHGRAEEEARVGC